MCTLSIEESRAIKKAGMSLTNQDLYKKEEYCMSWAGLKSLDMTHIRAVYGSLTTVDLSANKLKTLPDSFSASLGHVQYLDLSRNRLLSLPQNFGKMENLHTFLVYMNKLETLPVSFRKLDNLRWLDISSNPLEPRLLEICGEDLTCCEVVARNVIEFMRDLHNANSSSTEVPTPKKSQHGRVGHKNIPEISNFVQDSLLGGTDGDSMDELEKDEKNYKTKNQCKYEDNQFWAGLTKDDHQVRSNLMTSVAPVALTALYFILLSLSLFIFLSLSLALYNQGPPKGLLNGGAKLQKYDKVPSWALNSLAWAVHICPGCVPFRDNAVQTIVVRDSFFRSLMNLFFRPLYYFMN